MNYQIKEVDDKMLVTLAGDLYVKSAARLREDILKLIAQGKKVFVFDMKDLLYIDSAGLGVIITVQKRVLPQGGGVTIRGLKGVVRELFEQTRLDKIFAIEK